MVQSFWRDESFSYLLAKRNIWNIILLTAKDFNPPLYYLILHFWMKIFGSSEIALRSLSLIFYWATLYVAYLFLVNIMKLTGKKAILYLLLFLVNPLLTYYAFEARTYSLLAFLATLSFYALYKKDNRLYFAATILGLYTHYFMLFVVAAQLVYSRKLFKKSVWLFLTFTPWLALVITQKGLAAGSFWIEKPTVAIFKQLFGIIYTGYEIGYAGKDQPLTLISLVLMLLAVVGYLTVKRHKNERRLFWYLFMWGAGIPFIVAALSFFKPIFFPRYLIFSVVGFLLLLILILEKLPIYIRGLIIILFFVVTIQYLQADIKIRKKTDIRKTMSEIKKLAKKNDVVYATNELEFFDAQYYFGENRVFIYGKSYDEIPAYVGKILMPESKFVNSLPVYPKKAFILTTDNRYVIQAAY